MTGAKERIQPIRDQNGGAHERRAGPIAGDRLAAALTRGPCRLGCALFSETPQDSAMRADIVATAEAIKESVGLLRRHL